MRSAWVSKKSKIKCLLVLLIISRGESDTLASSKPAVGRETGMMNRGKTAARLMLGIFAIGHICVLWHAIAVTHAVCPHGKIIDASALPASSPHGHSGGHPHRHPSHGHRGDSHDGCTYLLSFTSVDKLVVVTAVAPSPVLVPVYPIQHTLPARLESKTKLFRLSPSQSPPLNAQG